MGKKYIIEMEESEMFDEQKFYRCSQMPWWYMSENFVENLTPYTAPDLEQVKADAYNDGYKAGREAEEVRQKIRQPDIEQIRKEAYEQGRKDGKNEGQAEAWNAAKKIALDKEDGGLDMVAYCEIFGYGKGFGTVLKTFTASEAIKKIRAYEQRQEEQIQIGDEVENTQTRVKFIVTHLWENNRGEQGVSGFNLECSAFSTTLSLVVKTGRHFPEVAAVLEKMREGAE